MRILDSQIALPAASVALTTTGNTAKKPLSNTVLTLTKFSPRTPPEAVAAIVLTFSVTFYVLLLSIHHNDSTILQQLEVKQNSPYLFEFHNQ